jgi:membrane associated rhomboid family serine protease
MYLLYNWSNYKKIIPIFLGGYLIFQNIEELLLDEKITNGSVYAHFGGMLGGLICFIIFIIQEKKQKSKNRIRVDS